MNELPRLTFQEELQQKPIHLARAGLRLAQEICYPELNVQDYLDRLAGMADYVRAAVGRTATRLEQVEAVSDYLFARQEFQGNSTEYNDPRNSYLNEVIDRRLGIPISLSVIYLTLANQAGLAAYGVGLPGHFIVGVSGDDGEIFLDPFHGGQRLSVIDCARLVEQTTGYSGVFQVEWLQPVPPVDILARMLYNLRNIYIQGDEWRLALTAVEYLAEMQPERAEHVRDLGTVHMQTGAYRKAIEYYQRYLVQAPQAEDANLVRQNLGDTAKKLSRLN